MSAPLSGNLSAVGDPTSLTKLAGKQGATAEQEKARLRKASKEFESFFTYYLMKTMRATIPENPLTKDLPFNNANGKEMMQDLFDMEVARTMRQPSDRSLSSMLYKSMSKLIDAKFAAREKPAAMLMPLNQSEQQAEPLPLTDDAPGIPIAQTRPVVLSRDLQFRLLPEFQHSADRTAENRQQNATPTAIESVIQEIERPHTTESDSNKTNPLDNQSEVPSQEVTPPERDGHRMSSIRSRFGALIDQAAAQHHIDSTLIEAVIAAESSGNPQAVSSTGARGLMQLMPRTAQELQVQNPFDPAQNIEAGTRYLKRMIDRFDDLSLALAAYNAGPGAVAAHGGIPPFPETQRYVERILQSATRQSVLRSHGQPKVSSQ